MDSITVGIVIAVAGLVFVLMNQAAWNWVKWIGWAVGNLVIGSIMLFLFNLVAESFSFEIPINPVTVTVTGFLGFPGLATLVIIKQFIL
ncbi:pro-sigmaK processing inhibitor BofA family protein [Aneurinibacillus aneurinilyticus]|uniref:Putative sigma-K factor processing regulatory protein BofA n=1 Tax=Aneurinibacillus aneurinilyticus ATCC 12856 TaxID=649747 RepID=U1WRG2_ANEAE|nr:pro-sigmaK processing inhibitor BofA family protein [Aneurinibacillus aneurinilyticus]ERI05225.1 putative sigma-K factor processing regulatory protein BofA [Aneurinibacillus aneurinilyticus ATCC 12856]MCI1694092.1 pro-sigmaK processing inhibitor BofA family protein [Aneurinibacillus aneurinilyticus]MED0708116.1 pro-sigmaK processing inhibitor BofA family protein [Aneurinibacillus aneurinilyticus]MED0721531.1 pro-sigmaK processing inhibitor BofA family protein [Aneurinibacillus aneurinilyticu